MADRPLSGRMVAILRYLAEDEGAQNYPQTAAQIALSIGFKTGPHRAGRGGGWSGMMSPAQHVIFSLNGLRERGLVRLARRPDERSGTAYRISAAGREALDPLPSREPEGEQR